MNGNFFFLNLCSRVHGAALCVGPFPPQKGASFRPAVGPGPRMCRVQTAAPLRPVSASALVSTTGGHFPASLCLCYGKRTRSPPERNRQTITLGGKAAKMQWADCKCQLGEGKKGPNYRGRAKFKYTPSVAASVQRMSALPS